MNDGFHVGKFHGFEKLVYRVRFLVNGRSPGVLNRHSNKKRTPDLKPRKETKRNERRKQITSAEKKKTEPFTRGGVAGCCQITLQP